jgi:hypothetical protein
MACSCGQSNPLTRTRCQRCGKFVIAGIPPLRALADGGAGLSLAVALAVIFWFSPRGEQAGSVEKLETIQQLDASKDAQNDEPVLERPLKLAVTPVEYDDMGKMLETLGSGYRYTEIKMDDLLDAAKLAPYDVVFLTCAGAPKEWLGQRLNTGQRDSAGVFADRAEILEQLKRGLRSYVAGGGTLYASDWQFQLLSIAFPEWIDKSREGRGMVQIVKAEVVDAALEKQLGATIDLKFDKPGWRPAAFDEKSVTVYLRGTYKLAGGQEATGPLLASFPHGNGTVIFTSFHNEAQNSKVESELLKNLVFTTVTAKVDTSVKQTMVRGGFSPRERNLLSASASEETASQTYECQGARQLQFVLGFENRGAELKLTVVAPDGSHRDKTGHSTFLIDVVNPPTGTWRYTVTPVKIPYPNFPFTMTVGEKQ